MQERRLGAGNPNIIIIINFVFFQFSTPDLGQKARQKEFYIFYNADFFSPIPVKHLFVEIPFFCIFSCFYYYYYYYFFLIHKSVLFLFLDLNHFVVWLCFFYCFWRFLIFLLSFSILLLTSYFHFTFALQKLYSRNSNRIFLIHQL